MKRRPLSDGAKSRARSVATSMRASALFETNEAIAAELRTLADAIASLGAVSPGTPKPGRILHVLDVMAVTGWSRTRAAKWVLGLEAWEADNATAWHKRLAKARSERARTALCVEREKAIVMYASGVGANKAARLATAVLQAKVR